MKKLFYVGLAGLAVFEILKVYFIMPFPGSQRINSLDMAYFMHTNSIYIRIFFVMLIIAGSFSAFRTRKFILPISLVAGVLAIVYIFNFKMMADKIFLEPQTLRFQPQASNVLGDSSFVIAVSHQEEVKAYPIQFMAYHHTVRDTIGGKPMLITYCNVCRTGRVFEPVVNGRYERFRLVGMDHFNAMLEDATTKSWWRQANGEAVTGPLKGMLLPEVEASQITVGKLFALYPDAVVMQADEAARSNYDSLAKFEKGKSEGKLTRTDTASWNEKSWVVGVTMGKSSKAYDWNQLKKDKIIHDNVGGKSIFIVLSDDSHSFGAFERNEADTFQIQGDTLYSGKAMYDFSGRSLSDTLVNLKKVNAYQEFWHSWRTFHPETLR